MTEKHLSSLPKRIAPPSPPISEECARVLHGFSEMPGLCLTAAQAGRLFGLPAPQCEAALRQLVASGYLRYHAGTYRRPCGI